MADKQVSAEEVIEAARGFLKATLNNAFDFDDKRLYDEHAERLEDLLTRYDAQPKPRWLKPEEVREEAFYWVSYEPIFDNPREVESVEYVVVINGVARLSKSLVHCRFYGPLPEPPPPEVE